MNKRQDGTMKMVDGHPRRQRLDYSQHTERIIDHAVSEIEELGAHPRLTDAVTLLAEARDALSDWLDEQIGDGDAPKTVHASDIKRMDIKDFLDAGYLHELNRQLLHPHGLAMEVVQEDDGSCKLGGVWDYRDDPEGMAFGDDTLSATKVNKIAEITAARRPAREAGLGYWVQPLPGETP
jgi:hypothetical protein